MRVRFIMVGVTCSAGASQCPDTTLAVSVVAPDDPPQQSYEYSQAVARKFINCWGTCLEEGSHMARQILLYAWDKAHNTQANKCGMIERIGLKYKTTANVCVQPQLMYLNAKIASISAFRSGEDNEEVAKCLTQRTKRCHKTTGRHSSIRSSR